MVIEEYQATLRAGPEQLHRLFVLELVLGVAGAEIAILIAAFSSLGDRGPVLTQCSSSLVPGEDNAHQPRQVNVDRFKATWSLYSIFLWLV